MDPLVLLSNPHFANKALAAAGYAAGLGDMDVRQLSEARVPVWALVTGCLFVGVVGGVYLARRLPPEWIVKDYRKR